MKGMQTCPVCGGLLPDFGEPNPPPESARCLPRSCPAWRTQAVYDHEKGEWLTTDDDGYVVDGRHIDEVK